MIKKHQENKIKWLKNIIYKLYVFCYNVFRKLRKGSDKMSRKDIKNIAKELANNKKEKKDFEKLIKLLLEEK